MTYVKLNSEGEKLNISRKTLANMIDSTNIKPAATKSEIENLCREAVRYHFGCVCVNPVYVKLASTILKGRKTKVCSTVGFPFGASLMEIKALEAFKAVEDGAKELDMVINLSLLKSRDYNTAKRDIAAVTDVKKLSKEIVVKVIIETGLLKNDEKIIACKLAREAGADFVKTSTGFFDKGATVKDVKLMRKTVGPNMGVKAAGGIKTYADAFKMIKAGANRIGTSSAAAIIKGMF
ncbi:MAG TPA: deoxyribose-phosphate aldolase [Candidatus Bathyarchaeia archaeon]|jgi:deoxyribose-phosphate aldolase|nr:deoxyribose-phosphate aldolase [Candidatus Bathyarchaeia archaeon]